jgi:hypothetical protein
VSWRQRLRTVRTGDLVFLWVVVVLDFLVMSHLYLVADARIHFAEEAREELGRSMAGYTLRDPVRWSVHQREADRRLEPLRRQRRYAAWSLLGAPLVGVAGTVLLRRRSIRRGAARAG